MQRSEFNDKTWNPPQRLLLEPKHGANRARTSASSKRSSSGTPKETQPKEPKGGVPVCTRADAQPFSFQSREFYSGAVSLAV